MTLADIPAGLEFCRESGWNQTPGDWELLIGLAPAGALVAEVDGVVAGTVINVPYRPAFDWIAMMLVRESLRGQGIGRVLMSAALEMSHGTVKLDATDAGRRLYLTLGFEDESTLARWRRAPSIATELSGTARPIAGSRLGEIATLDAEAFGADQAERPPMVWSTRPPNTRGSSGQVEIWRASSSAVMGTTPEHIGPVVATSAELPPSCWRLVWLVFLSARSPSTRRMRRGHSLVRSNHRASRDSGTSRGWRGAGTPLRARWRRSLRRQGLSWRDTGSSNAVGRLEPVPTSSTVKFYRSTGNFPHCAFMITRVSALSQLWKLFRRYGTPVAVRSAKAVVYRGVIV
jgi:GNAT superfamily N-acetyltransferase